MQEFFFLGGGERGEGGGWCRKFFFEVGIQNFFVSNKIFFCVENKNFFLIRNFVRLLESIKKDNYVGGMVV